MKKTIERVVFSMLRFSDRTRQLATRILDNRVFALSIYAGVVLMAVLTITQINITSTKGYDIRELEEKRAQLNKDYRELELASIELQSVKRIAAQMGDYQLTDASEVSYMNTSATTFAQR